MAAAARGRRSHRHQAQHLHHHARTEQRKDHRDDAHPADCIPSGQRCPSRKPRGKKGKKLGCSACCQGSFITEASGKKVCGCQPNGAACTGGWACCSGGCAAGLCQSPAPSNPSPRTCTSRVDCPPDHLCLDSGVCQPCDVTCPGSPCGNLVQNAVTTHPAQTTFVICPGEYVGNLSLQRDLTVIGAGDGDDASANTILRGTGSINSTQYPVVAISNLSQAVTLRHLRITGGNSGISHRGAALTVGDCTLIGNVIHGLGGGLNTGAASTAEMARCTIQNNRAFRGLGTDPFTRGVGGGIRNAAQMTLRDCVIAQNSAEISGAGIYNEGTLTLLHTVVGPLNAVDLGRDGGGIVNTGPGTVTLADGSLVCGNTPNQCSGFSDPVCDGPTCPS